MQNVHMKTVNALYFKRNLKEVQNVNVDLYNPLMLNDITKI